MPPTSNYPVILEFTDLDQLAETVWLLITRTTIHAAGRDIELTHQMWLDLNDEGKAAAREIAMQIYRIFAWQP